MLSVFKSPWNLFLCYFFFYLPGCVSRDVGQKGIEYSGGLGCDAETLVE